MTNEVATKTERVYWLVGIAFTLLLMLSSTWAAAVNVNDMKHSLHDVARQVSHNNDMLQEGEVIIKETLLVNQQRILDDMMALVYVNTNHILIRTSDGKELKIPMLHIVEEIRDEG